MVHKVRVVLDGGEVGLGQGLGVLEGVGVMDLEEDVIIIEVLFIDVAYLALVSCRRHLLVVCVHRRIGRLGIRVVAGDDTRVLVHHQVEVLSTHREV